MKDERAVNEWKKRAEQAEAKLSEVTASRDHWWSNSRAADRQLDSLRSQVEAAKQDLDEIAKIMDLPEGYTRADVVEGVRQVNANRKWKSKIADEMRARATTAAAALANVSGALVDAGSIVVPDDAMQYGEAIRGLISERDTLKADRDAEADVAAEREAFIETLRPYYPDAVRMLLRRGAK